MENSGKTLTAFLIGAACGAVAGVLLAPENGEETRARLARKADDLLEDMEEAWGISPEKIREFRDMFLAELEKVSKNFTERDS